MRELRYTLVSDGSSDAALLPILTWLLRAHSVTVAIQGVWADLWRLPRKPANLGEKIQSSIELYPCDLLFIHRDAEREPQLSRKNEIQQALETIHNSITIPPSVHVIPVRMQEAWLLFDASALRRAAGNPNGMNHLALPPLAKLESLPDPKATLHELLREASGLQGRRRRKFQANVGSKRVSELIDDFSPLRTLPGFKLLDFELSKVIKAQNWNI